MTLTGLFCGFRFRGHGYEYAAVGLRTEVHVTCGQCENRVVLADANIGARMPLRAALTQNNVAWNDSFAAELLYAKALGFGIATVTRGTASFLCAIGFSFKPCFPCRADQAATMSVMRTTV